jgi:glyceraldehyde 3-phosphate dehydrogenase
MTAIHIGLMGFGRIGRNLFRILYRRDDVKIVAISDTADPAALEYLLRFDTILGRFPDEVAVREGNLYAWGRQIRLLAGKNPGDVPWGELGVEVVVEATSLARSRRELERHLAMGAQRVLLCSPAADPPDLTVVMGINDADLSPEHRIVSNSSCTAHAAAPVLRLLDDAFGIERAFLTSVHAYTNQQRLADVPAEDLRTGRAAAENIIPQHTNAPQILEELLPSLRGRIRGMAMNVPVPNGSVVDLVCWHRKPVTKAAINEVVRTGAAARFPGILAYENAPLVSSDIIRSSYSGTFDGDATMVLGDRVSKTLCWFDNGWGYAHRAVDLVQRLGRLDRREEAA